MEARKRTLYYRIRYGWQTLAAYFVYGFFKLFPLDVASALGGAILGFIGPRTGKSRKVVVPQLAMAFPEKTAQERDGIMRAMWNNLGRVIAEYPHLHSIWRNVELVGGEYLAEARDSGRPAIFFAGHIANWEINAIGAKKIGVPLHLVYRKPNNPWVDSLLRHARNSGASGHIEKGPSGAREIVTILRKGGAIGMLVDQKMTEGLAIPFFGHNAMTAQAIAHFALKFDCPLYPSRIERLSGARFRMTVFPPLAIEKTQDRDADSLRIMTDINALLEGWVRARPEQWLWTHKRWQVAEKQH